MSKTERIRKVQESAPIIAAVLTNAVYTAELLYAQQGKKIDRNKIVVEVAELQGQLTTVLMGETE